MTNSPSPHVIQARQIEEAALRHRCPFCRADAGQACRSRTSGQDVWPHARRIALTRAPVQADRQQALCCECGQLRTVSERYYSGTAETDPNRGGGLFTDPRGWFDTKSLKCEQCGHKTRHALLAPEKRMPEFVEQYQRYVLGGEWGGTYAPDLERLRAEYFAQFPRNPNLHHRFLVDEAKQLLEQGETHMAAMCGAVQEIPRSWSETAAPKSELIEPGRIDWDTEYEDAETGEWWIDMDCVDCNRIANERRRERRRKRALELIDWYSTKTERLNHAEVEALIEFLEPAAIATYGRWQQEKNHADK
jgi:hypothetical protein